MKWKRARLLVGISTISLTGVGYYVIHGITENAKEYEAKELAKEVKDKQLEEKLVELEKSEKQRKVAEAEDREMEEWASNYEGIDFETGLSEGSSEKEVMAVMHKMTHQKVRAQEKWGAIPMGPQIINEVYHVIKTSTFKNKETMLEIATEWKNRDFSSIVEHHNYFWKLHEGTIGKAYGTLSRVEEKEFIEQHFKQKKDIPL